MLCPRSQLCPLPAWSPSSNQGLLSWWFLWRRWEGLGCWSSHHRLFWNGTPGSKVSSDNTRLRVKNTSSFQGYPFIVCSFGGCSSQTERDQKTRAIGILLWKPCVSCWWPKSLTTQMLPFYNHGTFLLQSGGWFCPSIFFRFFQCTSVMKTIYCCFQWETTMFQVFRTRWWMGAYGSTTPKRHVGYSNAKSIGLLNLGTLKWDYSSAKYQQNKTTKRSTKGQKKQFTGVKKTLKASQKLGCAVEPKTLLSNFFFKFWDGFR